MKTVTVQQLERDFDRIVDDVIENEVHYKITFEYANEDGTFEDKSVMLIPYNNYEVLASVYEDWLKQDSDF